MYRTSVFLTTVVAASLCGACSSALPKRELPHEIARYAVHADQAATQAEQSAKHAEELYHMSERLHAEAQKLVQRADAARAYCEEVKKKIPKQKVVYIKQKVTAEEEDEEGEVAPKNDGPKYSPSDAPVE